MCSERRGNVGVAPCSTQRGGTGLADPAWGQTPSVWGLGYHSLPCPLSFCQLPGVFCWGLEAIRRGLYMGLLSTGF